MLAMFWEFCIEHVSVRAISIIKCVYKCTVRLEKDGVTH